MGEPPYLQGVVMRTTSGIYTATWDKKKKITESYGTTEKRINNLIEKIIDMEESSISESVFSLVESSDITMNEILCIASIGIFKMLKDAHLLEILKEALGE